MTTNNLPMALGIVGCGNIADAYIRHLGNASEIKILGVIDLIPERAEAMAARYNCRAYSSLDEMLADDAIQIIVNLTIHHAHYDVTRRCLEAGRHVYSEKPLSMTYDEAQALVDLAEARGLRLSCAPIVFLGESQQTARNFVASQRLGPVRVAYAEVNWGRIETWHPAPEPFYDVGPVFDVGVYPITVLTAIFGPARQVSAHSRLLYPRRVRTDGVPYEITTPDFSLALIELEQGPLIRLTSNFYVHQKAQPATMTLHGDDGSLRLSHWFPFDADVAFAPYGEEYEPVPLVRPAVGPGVQWQRGIEDMVQAIAEERPHRVTGQHAAHVVEIMAAITESAQTHQPVQLTSTFTPPAPMPWAEATKETANQ
jgi:predicted dehydrogenase